ncbi:hypothetical protein CVT25_005679 [Psilocybe cyanescens]|uniref:Major facilitator superfamily (MFS) profile domain-containing protein n=1 Tax=Psilocybe cyanescens TaxID=93625 RepID=A0A409VLH1_PSICY|nr:hypothetical protein CVT25_005679 [Psilocybe cyanescens]
MADHPTHRRRRLVGKPLLYSISVFASLGVFLFGYDQGVMSGIITGPYFRKYFNYPGPIETGTVVAVLEIGAFITSVAAGWVGDTIGRKGTLFIGAVIFTIGGAIQTFTIGFWSMLLGRIVSGFGVGLLSTIVPIYQSEISPPNHRGALACMEFTGNIIGYSSSVWTDYFCSFIDSDMSWRIPLFLQCVIGVILAAGSLLIPESPRWLIDTGREADGMRVLADLHDGNLHNPVAVAEYEEIKDKVREDRESGEARTYSVMWRKYKRRVLLAMSSQAFAQLVRASYFVITFNARLTKETCRMELMVSLPSYFSSYPLHFNLLLVMAVISYYARLRKTAEAGWIGRQALLMTGINSFIYVLSTIPTWYLVDHWGRRAILLSGAVIMAASLVATGWWMYIDVPQTPNAVVICVVIFNAAFGYSWGPIPWLYPPEIMPLNVRAKGVSLSTATNWAFNFLVGEITPYLQDLIEWRLYPMHGFFCISSFVLVYFCELICVFIFLGMLNSGMQCIRKPKAFLWKRWMLFSAKVCAFLLCFISLSSVQSPMAEEREEASDYASETVSLAQSRHSDLERRDRNVEPSWCSTPQRVFYRTWPRNAAHVRSMSGTYEAYADAMAKRKPTETPRPIKERMSFPALGVEQSFVKALQTAFPDVEKPTGVQEKLIPEILGGKDILVKDSTGSGKSFGLVLGLLNKPRMVIHDEKKGKKRVITTLFIVPHRDLAYQLLCWIERLTSALRPSPPLSSIAQVLVRGGGGQKEKMIEELKKTPPHILICTPQALMEVYEKEAEALELKTLSTVVVDEVDYLVEIDPRKLEKHPGTTREILNMIYAKRKELNQTEYSVEDDEEGRFESIREWRNEREREEGIPQLILSSATLRVHFKDYLFEESGWLNTHNLVKIKGEQGQGQGKILHSILVVKKDGVVNAEGAKKARVASGMMKEGEERELEEAAEDEEDEEVVTRSYYHEKYGRTPSPFDANALEAIATGFALDVARIALLVIPSAAAVQRIVYELRQMGVNAEGLDLLIERRGRGYLAEGSESNKVSANPRLLVATAATTRGLDLPGLSHVFVLGLPEGRVVESYRHIAGRVGRSPISTRARLWLTAMLSSPLLLPFLFFLFSLASSQSSESLSFSLTTGSVTLTIPTSRPGQQSSLITTVLPGVFNVTYTITPTSSSTPTPTPTPTQSPSPSPSPDPFVLASPSLLSLAASPYFFHQNTRVDPAFAVLGVILILTGLPSAFWGHKNRWTSFFLIGFYTLSLVCIVLILKFGVIPSVNPPNKTLRGMFVLASTIAGIAGGGVAIFFWKGARYGIGAWGGFALGLWIQCFHNGGLINSVGFRWILYIGCGVAGFALSTIPKIHYHVLLISTAFVGATSFMLGVDCFTTAGLKEFYVWNLGFPALFPKYTENHIQFPVSQTMQIELGLIGAVALMGIAVQLRILKVLQRKMREIAEENKKRDEEAELRAADRLTDIDQERDAWEKEHPTLTKHGRQDSTMSSLPLMKEREDSASPIPDPRSSYLLDEPRPRHASGLSDFKVAPTSEDDLKRAARHSNQPPGSLLPNLDLGSRIQEDVPSSFIADDVMNRQVQVSASELEDYKRKQELLAEIQTIRRSIDFLKSETPIPPSSSEASRRPSFASKRTLSMDATNVLQPASHARPPREAAPRARVHSMELSSLVNSSNDPITRPTSVPLKDSDWDSYIQERKLLQPPAGITPPIVTNRVPMAPAVQEALQRRKRRESALGVAAPSTDSSEDVPLARVIQQKPNQFTPVTILPPRRMSANIVAPVPQIPPNTRTRTFEELTERHREKLRDMQAPLTQAEKEHAELEAARQRWERSKALEKEAVTRRQAEKVAALEKRKKTDGGDPRRSSAEARRHSQSLSADKLANQGGPSSRRLSTMKVEDWQRYQQDAEMGVKTEQAGGVGSSKRDSRAAGNVPFPQETRRKSRDFLS